MAAALTGVALALAAEVLVEWQITKPQSPPPPVHAAPGPVSTAQPPAKPLPAAEKAPGPLRRLQVSYDGESLGAAAGAGDVAAVQANLAAGVSADALNAAGKPALLTAVDAGQAAAARLLLEEAADPDVCAANGKTPLMLAAERGDLALVDLLLEFGAATDFRDAWGHTPLGCAVREKQGEAAARLMAAGARRGAECCGGGESLTTHALASESVPLLDAVLQYTKPEAWTRASREALMGAIRRQDRPLLRALLSGHTAPPTPEGFAQPLLGYAIAWGQEDVVRLLLECGADANTPLGSPVEPAFARLVEQKVLRFYLQKEGGMTPLMLAAGMARLESVRALMEHGARRGAVTSKSRWAALSFAARTQNTAVMQVLLGKDPQQQRVRVEISLGSQVARLWRDNQLVLTARISSGRAGFRTPSGEFVVTDKHRRRVSSIYRVEMPYFMRLSCSEYGMHAGVVPNYPASHGCIRLPHDVARRLFREVEVGTLVTIR